MAAMTLFFENCGGPKVSPVLSETSFNSSKTLGVCCIWGIGIVHWHPVQNLKDSRPSAILLWCSCMRGIPSRWAKCPEVWVIRRLGQQDWSSHVIPSFSESVFVVAFDKSARPSNKISLLSSYLSRPMLNVSLTQHHNLVPCGSVSSGDVAAQNLGWPRQTHSAAGKKTKWFNVEMFKRQKCTSAVCL